MMIILLKFIHLASLAAWVGSFTFFSFFAAPSIFKVLDRETAGRVVGDIFPKYWAVGYVSSVTALASLVVLSYTDGRWPVARVAVLAVATALSFYTGAVVGGKARGLKARMREGATEERERLRTEFRKVHGLSSLLNLAIIALGYVVIFFTSISPGL